jgi:hypothetical protein
MIHTKKVKFKAISISEEETESFYQRVKRLSKESYDKHNTAARSQELAEIEKKIEAAAIKGDHGIDVSIAFKVTVSSLRDMGFVCIPIDISSRNNFHISWQ